MLLVIIFATLGVGVLSSDQKPAPVDPWKEVAAAGGLYVGGGRMKRFVQVNESQPNIEYQACKLPDGKGGHCKHINYCMKDEYKENIFKFTEHLCIIEKLTIGLCCPDKEGPAGLAGDLPATAPREEKSDLVTKIMRAENRGCGLSTRPHGRTTGSRASNPREWPWMAFVTPKGYMQYCGGVLITDRHVLTAAHCTRRWKAENLRVRLGEYDYSRNNDSRSYNFQVLEIRQHVNYEVPSYHHDIAILKLHRQAVFNTYVWPICLPPLGLQLTNETGVVIGWGKKWYGGPTSDVLMEVSVPIWDSQSCADAILNSVFEENLCAGGYEGGKDACQGDSGGPLLYQLPSGRWVVIGVVSWGVGCGEANHPGIYTRVDKYLSWIVENVSF